jgi:peptide deformylase
LPPGAAANPRAILPKMAVRDIVRLGHPALRTPAEVVPEAVLAGADTQRLIDDLIETMVAASGVGLAAPQVGIGAQIFVYDSAPESAADGAPGDVRVLVNPTIAPQPGDLVDDWEGCLSIPDLRGLVPRHPEVRVRALDRHGKPVDYLTAGLPARIVQHENDHLNGIVFLDRMRDLRSLAFYAEWERYLAGDDGEARVG